MTRTKDAAAARPSIEVCPVCASVDVRVREPEWFVLELDRAAELRGDVRVEFSCHDCGETWY
jgi:hypothetical protein